MSIPRILSPGRYRAYVLGAWLVLGLGCGSLVALELRRAEQASLAVARERGATLFGLIESMHDWNARHGGIFVPLSGTEQDGDRAASETTLITSTGRRLGIVDPTTMTAEIAELTLASSGARIELTDFGAHGIESDGETSQRGRAASQAFAGSDVEDRIALVEERGVPAFRYVAPLRVREPCLNCHANQGYQIGQIRGILTLTMPGAEAHASRAATARATASMSPDSG